jgi:hypothetical protein
MRPRSAVVAASLIAAGVALYGACLWLLWRPVLADVWGGHSLQGSVKNWYLGDQLTYLSIAANVQDGRSAYLEPFTSTAWSIYPSGYYWLLGLFGSLTRTNTFFAWNMLGMASTLGLAGVCGWWGRWALRSRVGWLLGPLPLLLGTLTWWANESWRAMFGPQAVLWPGFVIVFNPGAETPGLVLAVAGVLCAVKALGRTPWDLRWLAASGALLGLNMNVHTYTTLFSITIVVCTLLAFHFLQPVSRRAVTVTVGSILVSWIVVLSGVVTAALGLLALVLAGLVVPMLLVGEWREHRRALLAFLGAAAVAALPMVARIAADVLKEDSFLSYRQQVAQDDALSLPLYEVVTHTLPVLALVGCALVALLAARQQAHERAWAAALVGGVVGSTVLLFNAAWGMNQEPYRFYPYAQLVLAALALPWLLRPVRRWQHALPRVAVVAGLLATMPTTLSFLDYTRPLVLRFTPAHREAFDAVADRLPRHGVALVDTCLPRRAFKALTETDVADYNAGLALPTRRHEITKVLDEQRRGILSSGADLAAAGVTSFVTAGYCNSVDRAELVRRFGVPIVTVGPADAETCKLPPGTVFEAYRTTGDRSGPSTVPGVDPAAPQPFRPGFGPDPACAYAFTT